MPRDPQRRQCASTKESGRTDRGLSEVLSYALVFSMIVVSIGIVTVGGLGSLQDARANEHVSNAERAYDVLYDNMADVHQEGAPSRATEIALSDAQLYFGDYVTVEVETSAGTIDRQLRPLVFRVEGERKVVYEAGATLQTQRDGGLVVNNPPFMLRDSPDTVHVPIVQTRAPSQVSVGGGTVLVRGQSAGASVAVEGTGGIEISNISLDTPRAETWAQYFRQQSYCDAPDVSVSGSVVTCPIESSYRVPDQLYVTVNPIDVSLVK